MQELIFIILLIGVCVYLYDVFVMRSSSTTEVKKSSSKKSKSKISSSDNNSLDDVNSIVNKS